MSLRLLLDKVPMLLVVFPHERPTISYFSDVLQYRQVAFWTAL